MHMLEDHVTDWIRKWKVGLGFHGEQGAESTHARFNTLMRTYSSIRNPLDRLKAVVKEHNKSVMPHAGGTASPSSEKKEDCNNRLISVIDKIYSCHNMQSFADKK